MELAGYSKKMGLKASVEWSPREANREADARSAIGSSNGLCSHRPSRAGQKEAHQAAKVTGLPTRNQKRSWRRPEERLKAVEPW